MIGIFRFSHGKRQSLERTRFNLKLSGEYQTFASLKLNQLLRLESARPASAIRRKLAKKSASLPSSQSGRVGAFDARFGVSAECKLLQRSACCASRVRARPGAQILSRSISHDERCYPCLKPRMLKNKTHLVTLTLN